MYLLGTNIHAQSQWQMTQMHVYLLQVWNEMEQRLHIGPPEPGSDREKEFDDGVKQIQNKIQNIIDRRRNGEDQDDIPFIDALLQSSVPDEQVILIIKYDSTIRQIAIPVNQHK